MFDWLLGVLLLLSSLGVILVRKPVHASLCFLLSLLSLAALYLQLSAQFIAVMQVLVYAGAILVIFMFVIILFQDAHQQIDLFEAKSATPFLWITSLLFVTVLFFTARQFIGIQTTAPISIEHGMVESIGRTLYLDFFFPFEAVILLFLVALVGAIYVGKKS